ncbi:MAG: hypothetical protein KJ574_00195 [Nanoarchaeota archaeon]|nr:hypothetical protein [Nanoarchaeota archaeon]
MTNPPPKPPRRSQVPTYDATQADKNGRMPVISYGVVNSQLPFELHKKLYQTATEEEEGHDGSQRGEEITVSESNLITAMLTATYPKIKHGDFVNVQENLERHGQQLLPALLGRKGPEYQRALQFLHLVEACGGPKEEVIKDLIKRYGFAYGIYKPGELSSASHLSPDILKGIDPAAFPEIYIRMKKKIYDAAKLDIVKYLAEEYPNRSKLEQGAIILPRAIPANNGWIVFYAGLGAEPHQFRSTEAQDRFAKFIANVTGEDSEHVRVAMNYAMDKGGLIRTSDDMVNRAIEDILSGNDPKNIPLELQRLASHAKLYTEATQDGILDPEEAELLKTYASLVDGIRNNDRLFQKEGIIMGGTARNTVNQLEETVQTADKLLERTDLTEDQLEHVRQTKVTSEAQLRSTKDKNKAFPIDIVIDYLQKRSK